MTIEDLKKAVTKDGAEINVRIGFHNYPVKHAGMTYFNYLGDSHPNHWALVLEIDEEALRKNWPGDVYEQAIITVNEKVRKWEELSKYREMLDSMKKMEGIIPEEEISSIRNRLEDYIKAKEDELK